MQKEKDTFSPWLLFCFDPSMKHGFDATHVTCTVLKSIHANITARHDQRDLRLKIREKGRMLLCRLLTSITTKFTFACVDHSFLFLFTDLIAYHVPQAFGRCQVVVFFFFSLHLHLPLQCRGVELVNGSGWTHGLEFGSSVIRYWLILKTLVGPYIDPDRAGLTGQKNLRFGFNFRRCIESTKSQWT